jgi:hypothetical protein
MTWFMERLPSVTDTVLYGQQNPLFVIVGNAA